MCRIPREGKDGGGGGELTLDGVEVDDAGLVLGELEHIVGTL